MEVDEVVVAAPAADGAAKKAKKAKRRKGAPAGTLAPLSFGDEEAEAQLASASFDDKHKHGKGAKRRQMRAAVAYSTDAAPRAPENEPTRGLYSAEGLQALIASQRFQMAAPKKTNSLELMLSILHMRVAGASKGRLGVLLGAMARF